MVWNLTSLLIILVPNERGVNVSEIFKKNINIEKDDSSEQLEIYFSCHDRMVNGSYLDDEETIRMYKINFISWRN